MTSAWRRQTRVAALLSGSSTAISGALSGLSLVIVARRGGSTELGAFVAGTGVGSVANAVLAYGTSLRYAVANAAEQAALERWRLMRQFPATVLIVVGSAFFYSRRGFNAAEVLEAGLAVALNGLCEVSYIRLQLDLAFRKSASIVVASKALAILLIAAGVPLSTAVLFAAIAQVLLLEVFRVSRWISRTRRDRIRLPIRRSHSLAAYSISEVVASRSDALLVSVLAGPAVTARYGLIYGIFTTATGVLYSFAQVLLPLFSRARTDEDRPVRPVVELQFAVTLLSAVGAAFAIALAPILVQLASGRSDDDATGWLRILCLALPLVIGSRAIALSLISTSRFRDAAMIVMIPTALGVMLYGVLIPLFGPLGGAVGTVAQEALAAAIAMKLRRQPGR